MFVTYVHFHHLQARLEPTRVEHIMELHSNGKLVHKYGTRVEVNGSGKYFSLLQYEAIANIKRFILQAP